MPMHFYEILHWLNKAVLYSVLLLLTLWVLRVEGSTGVLSYNAKESKAHPKMRLT